MPQLTAKYDEALTLAADLHRTQMRKGSGVPYLAHLMSVSALVLENGGSEEEAIAGLLHDAIEDARDGRTPDEVRDMIRGRFGNAVLEIVEGCTDADADEKSEEAAASREVRKERWWERKRKYVQRLEGAPAPELLVAAADKVHNARAIVRDVQLKGRPFFDEFVGQEDGTLWYYEALTEVLRRRVGVEPRIGWLVAELERVVEVMRGLEVQAGG